MPHHTDKIIYLSSCCDEVVADVLVMLQVTVVLTAAPVAECMSHY